jgi:ketosteroid isomerase-like protein
MPAAENKQRMQEIFAALERGDGRPFVDAMADDFSWIISGGGPWSRAWRGKQAVRKELFAPLFAQFEGTYTNRASRFVAEGDTVVVECRGNVATKRGERYDNHYCYVCTFRDGKLVELVEYMDTALAERVLTPPPTGG